MTVEANKRIRHEAARRRTLKVKNKRLLAPNYLAIVFHCDDFGDFASLSPDDHIKLFLAGAPDERGRPPMRDYTPRAFNPDAGEFTIEFALHEDPGPATAWAIAAEVGDTIEIGGPRGSVVIPGSYDWYWLIGDETAIPAIARRLSECPDSTVEVLIAVAGPEEQIDLPSSSSHKIQWLHRPPKAADKPDAFLEGIEKMSLPEGDGFVWIAAEASVAKTLREALINKGHPMKQMKAAGYWTMGQADKTARFD